MGWFFACDHGVVGHCAVCGSLAVPRRATDAVRRQAAAVPRDDTDAGTAALRAAHRRELTELADELDAEQEMRERIAYVLARDTRRIGWWRRRADRLI